MFSYEENVDCYRLGHDILLCDNVVTDAPGSRLPPSTAGRIFSWVCQDCGVS
jgi:hypothetical protein